MTIKELFGHAIGVVKFGDIAKFYNWLTRRDHTLKGDITFTGEVNFADATVSGLSSSGGDGIYGGSGVVSDGTYATLEGAFRFQTEAEDDNYLSIAPYDDGLRFDFLTTSVDYDGQVEVTLNPEEGVYARSVRSSNYFSEVSLRPGGLYLKNTDIPNQTDAAMAIEHGKIEITAQSTQGAVGQVLKKDVNNEVAWGDPRPYKVYTALLTQSGTNAPVAAVLENTLGGVPVWSYNSTGLYFLTLEGVFTSNKTFAPVRTGFTNQENSDSRFSLYINNGGTEDYIILSTVDDTRDSADGILAQTPIEIRVYD